MDKPRHPHVVRTWTVERTKFPIRNPNLDRVHSRAPGNKPRAPKPRSGKIPPPAK